MLTHSFSSDLVSEVGNCLLGENVEWYYTPATCSATGGCATDSRTKDVAQFIHYMYIDGVVTSNIFAVVKPLITELEETLQRSLLLRLQRVKANMVVCYPTYDENCYHTPHVDHYSVGAETLLYYVNNSDGRTTFFKSNNGLLNETHTEDPREGTGVLFDSTIYHAGSSPKVADRRVVLNFVFNPELTV